MQKKLLKIYPYVMGGYTLITLVGALYIATEGAFILAATFTSLAVGTGILSWGSFRFGNKHNIPQPWLRVATFFSFLALVLFLTSVASTRY
ncbi:hypothetical protein Trad_0282 [Truepera radiovictrix DSM 17093]|uniref:Uncharacterized protein n=1 Tax=Truepera radiovictrix (strain DSM 17093 / CIP 108686 / LMG 22925 / RQ-24) TaxID=649638 RepID=D7CR22_TRURR|nr:hypothetical protein Trad_0282 [Truepera radiovictrix DSM 17093]